MARIDFDIPDKFAQDLYLIAAAYIKAYLRSNKDKIPDLTAIKEYAEGQQGEGG